jgi:hypothetical protein
MLDFRRVVKNRKIQPEAAFCPTKNQGLEWMNSNPRMQIAKIFTARFRLPRGRMAAGLKGKMNEYPSSYSPDVSNAGSK